MSIDARHTGRILALQALFAQDMCDQSQDTLEWLADEDDYYVDSVYFARELVEGVRCESIALDQQIHEYAPAWPTAQLSVVDRNILRIALYEVLFQKKAPLKSVVNEAVELAKAFGSDTSARFVNGVLGSVVSDIGQEVNIIA